MAQRKKLPFSLKDHPWYEPAAIEGVLFGRNIVFKVTFPDRVCYSIWEPHTPRPATGDPQQDFLRLHGMVITEDDSAYQHMDAWHFLPGTVPDGIHSRKEFGETWRAAEQAWKKAQLDRLRVLVSMWFPEAEKGFIVRCGTITILTGDRLTTTDLDDLIDNGMSLEPYIGWKVSHDCFGEGGRLVKLDATDEESKFAVRWKMKCGHCPNRVTVYTGRGCHHGAWCYVVDREGDYVADLRNQYVLCQTCSGEKKRKKRARQKA